MTIYICYEVNFNYCNEFQHVVKVVDSEEKALEWVSEVEPAETEWREYECFKVE